MLVNHSQPVEPGGRSNKRPEVREKDIEGLKFFAKLRPLLDQLHEAATGAATGVGAPNSINERPVGRYDRF